MVLITCLAALALWPGNEQLLPAVLLLLDEGRQQPHPSALAAAGTLGGAAGAAAAADEAAGLYRGQEVAVIMAVCGNSSAVAASLVTIKSLMMFAVSVNYTYRLIVVVERTGTNPTPRR